TQISEIHQPKFCSPAFTRKSLGRIPSEGIRTIYFICRHDTLRSVSVRFPPRIIGLSGGFMSTAQVVTAGGTPFLSRKWIIDSGDDLIWFILSVVASYALLMMFTVLHWNPVVLLLTWAIVFDGPHVFGTFSRTYLNNEERKTRAKLLYGSLLFF